MDSVNQDPASQHTDPTDAFGKHYHDQQCPTHSGNRGHFCDQWDGLWICEDCEEFQVCTCFDKPDAETP
jgi:hypothetical protein